MLKIIEEELIMSNIDNFNHVHVGSFQDIPIYLLPQSESKYELLETDLNLKASDEAIDTTNLLIGGGSGEHPVLIINNDAAVLEVLCSLKFESFVAKEEELLDEITDFLLSEEGQRLNCLGVDQNQWFIEEWVKVHDAFKKSGLLTDQYTTQETLLENMGLFILLNLPLDKCLKNEKLKKLAKNFQTSMYDQFRLQQALEMTKPVQADQECFGTKFMNKSKVYTYSLEEWLSDN